MNKYFIIIAILILIVVAGVSYSTFFVDEADKPLETGRVREMTVTAREDRWQFDPEFIEVDQGDRVILNVVNMDSYDHGFSIDAFGITQRMPANETITIEFVATRPGDFPFYCSVPCGSGEVDGETRGHFDQIGRLHVRSVMGETFITAETGDTTEVSDPVDTAVSDITEPVETEIDTVPMLQENQTVSDALASAIVASANIKAQELDYTPERLRPMFDRGNNHWLSYHRSVGEPYLNPEFGFLFESDNYYTVYYSASGKLVGADLWIFLDTQGGEVLGYIEEI